MKPLSKNAKEELRIVLGSQEFGDEYIEKIESLTQASEVIKFVRDYGTDDGTATGSLSNPYRTADVAQLSFDDEAVDTDLGPQQNFNKQYVIDIGAGSDFITNDWTPKQYVNYHGAGDNFTSLFRPDGGIIDFQYGDNYGFTMIFKDLGIFGLHITRAPGFTNGAFQPTFTDFFFQNCTTGNRFVGTGSGFDLGFPTLVFVEPDAGYVSDAFHFIDCSSNNIRIHGAFVSIENHTGNGTLFYDSQGTDGNVPTSGSFQSFIRNSSFDNIRLFDYCQLTATNSQVLNVRINGRTTDDRYIALYGPAPFYNGDATSQPRFGYQLTGAAAQDQILYLNDRPETNVDYVTAGTPYVNVNSKILIAQGGAPGSDITLAPGFKQEINGYAKDIAVNDITVRMPKFWKWSPALGGTDTLTMGGLPGSPNNLSVYPTNLGSDPGMAQIIDVITVADIAGSLNSSFFTLTLLSQIQGILPYVLWFNVDNTGTAPTGFSQATKVLEVPINAGMSAPEVCAQMFKVMNLDDSVVAPNSFAASNFVGGSGENTRVYVRADHDGDLNNTWFSFYSAFNQHKLVVWFNVDGLGVQPSVPGTDKYYEVAIHANDDIDTVSFAWLLVVDAENSNFPSNDYQPFNQSNIVDPNNYYEFALSLDLISEVEYGGHLFASQTGDPISLVFDGAMTVSAVVSAWNILNPSNTVMFTGSGSDVPTAGSADLIPHFVGGIFTVIPGHCTPAADGTTGFIFEELNAGSDTSEITFSTYANGAAASPVDGSTPTGFAFSTPTPGVDKIAGTFTTNP